MGELSNYHIGQHVELSDGRAAIVQFIGNTHFAAGDWVGVELENGSGKNDGEVQGQRYFDCPENHGMFVRPAAITILDHPTLQPSHRVNGNINGATPKPRPSSMTVGGSKRQSVLDPVASKRQSINAASPTPPSRVSRLAVRVSDPDTALPFNRLTLAPVTQQITNQAIWLYYILGNFNTNRHAFQPGPKINSTFWEEQLYVHGPSTTYFIPGPSIQTINRWHPEWPLEAFKPGVIFITRDFRPSLSTSRR